MVPSSVFFVSVMLFIVACLFFIYFRSFLNVSCMFSSHASILFIHTSTLFPRFWIIVPVAAAKSLQLCLTLCDPIDDSPPGSLIPGILQARTLVGYHLLLQYMKVKSESEAVQSRPTPSNPMCCSLSGSSIHGIFQARVLEWIAIAFSLLSLLWTIFQVDWLFPLHLCGPVIVGFTMLFHLLHVSLSFHVVYLLCLGSLFHKLHSCSSYLWSFPQACEVGPVPCEGFFFGDGGLFLVFWFLELNLVSLKESATLSVVLYGFCELGMTLGSLSANG